jgi:hypothetical protein
MENVIEETYDIWWYHAGAPDAPVLLPFEIINSKLPPWRPLASSELPRSSFGCVHSIEPQRRPGATLCQFLRWHSTPSRVPHRVYNTFNKQREQPRWISTLSTTFFLITLLEW